MSVKVRTKLFKWYDDEGMKFKQTSFSNMYQLAKVNEDILFIPVYENIKVDREVLKKHRKYLKHWVIIKYKF